MAWRSTNSAHASISEPEFLTAQESNQDFIARMTRPPRDWYSGLPHETKGVLIDSESPDYRRLVILATIGAGVLDNVPDLEKA